MAAISITTGGDNGCTYRVPPNSPAPDFNVGAKRKKAQGGPEAFLAELAVKCRAVEKRYRDLTPQGDKKSLECAVSAYKKGLIMEHEVVQIRVKEYQDKAAKRARITQYISGALPASQQAPTITTGAAEKNTQRSPVLGPGTVTAPSPAPAPASAVESR